MNRAVRKALHRYFRQAVEDRSRGCVTMTNAQVRATLDACWVDGQIGVILAGMDCDCTQYYREYRLTCPNNVAWFKRHWDQHCEWLDGPESQSFVRPDAITPQHRSRDLALMAYEDGHPSRVTPVSFDELVPNGEY